MLYPSGFHRRNDLSERAVYATPHSGASLRKHRRSVANRRTFIKASLTATAAVAGSVLWTGRYHPPRR
ncbi:MAG: twin-arginine translocation signal domain-containing protein [Bilophila wadsworthia]